jgi:hypothetical protein
MAYVSLTDYEIEHDAMPAICATCAEPATNRVLMGICVVDGWRGALLLPVLLFGLFFFPPLLFWITMNSKLRITVRVPMCDRHRDEQNWRDRVTRRRMLPIWTAVALIMDAMIVAELFMRGPGLSCGAAVVAMMAVLVADGTLISRGGIKLMRPGKTGLMLRTVHEGFVAAIVEDRARDRIDNPLRRWGHGDVRDDYDDEAN